MPVDGALIARAARLVEAARGLADDYAGAGAPVPPDQLRVLLQASGCHVEVFAFRSDALGMTLPMCEGVHPVLVNGDPAGIDPWFALADSVPGWWIERVVRGHGSWRTVERVVGGCIARLAPAWPVERVQDRAELRLRLFCEAGI